MSTIITRNSAPLRILFIEGYCTVPGMESSFVGRPSPRSGKRRAPPSVSPFPGRHSIFRVWCTNPECLNEDNVMPNAFGVKRCQDEIRSGKYHAIIVVDYAHRVHDFEQAFGKLLQKFARAGGVVAFPSSEGKKILTTLKKYFCVKWKYSEYHRETWEACLDDNKINIYRNFGYGTFLERGDLKDYSYSAKGGSMTVPKHERCFGSPTGDGNYDVIVAVHNFGRGAVAYFGDVNGEDQTIALVAAFVESRSPRKTVDNLLPIEQPIMALDVRRDSPALNILFIEGYCNFSSMASTYIGCPLIGFPPPVPYFPGRHSIFRVWCTNPHHLGDDNVPPDAFGVKRCQDEIRSGKYHAIVVVDFSRPELIHDFEQAFGKLLQKFARAGGVVVFPSAEGKIILRTLKKYFEVEWQYSEYHRETWETCTDDNKINIYRNFANGSFLSRRDIKHYSFSAKGGSLTVPKHERCFGSPTGEGNYDVIVAVHDCGRGAVAYFGDVNSEDQTIALVAAFVESRSPDKPIESSIFWKNR